MTTATRPTETTLTKADEYRREVSADLAEAYRRLGKAQLEANRCANSKKAADSAVKEIQDEVNGLVQELADIQNGQYQPKLFNKPTSTNGTPQAEQREPAATPAVDEGAEMTIQALSVYGLTEKECEKLEQSELELTTVGKLEKAIREDPTWHRKVKGFGQSKVDKLIDALVSFRKEYPVPSPDDAEEQNDAPAVDTSAEPTANYPDRNAVGGKACGNVNRFRVERDWGAVTIACGVMPDQTWRSSSLYKPINGKTVGRETPREDSEPHGTIQEAGRAAAMELIESLMGQQLPERADELRQWIDAEWPVVPTDTELTE